MSKIREHAWQEMSQGNARYCWSVVRKLKQHGVQDIPVPHVPDQHNADLSDLEHAEHTFEEALDFCKTYTPTEWRNQYGVTSINAAIDRLERALDHIKQEKQRIKQDQQQRQSKLNDDLPLTVVR